MGRKKHRIICYGLSAAALLFCLFLCSGYGLVSHAKEKEWKPQGLKVELREEAYGIDTKSPGFSWEMNSRKENIFQEKYRIVIADSRKKLEEKTYLFDTGWCADASNTARRIEGLENILEDNTLYYWKVALEDSKGERSLFSDAAVFSTAVGKEWVSTEGIWTREMSEYAFLRTQFLLKEKLENVEKALLSVTALSPEETRQYVYHLYLNGTHVGLGPSRLMGNKITYNTYDVTSCLKQENVLGAVCYSTKDQAFLCQMTLFYEDGTKEVILNSGRDREQWKVWNGNEAYGKRDSWISTEGVLISTPYYMAHAENLNLRKYPEQWLKGVLEDSDWDKPAVSAKLNKEWFIPYASENMERYEVVPAKVEVKESGHYFVDFGREIVGGLHIESFSPSVGSTKLVVHYGEELAPDGTVKYRMRTGNVYEEMWTLKHGIQSCETMGMKTFRYVDIYCESLMFTDIKGVAYRQAFAEEASEFSSSNPLMNEIYKLAKYTIKATNQNLYVDSQSRERAPYEGDVFLNALASYAVSNHYSLARFSNEYVIRERTWPAEYPMYAVLCAYQDYLYTGDKGLLERYYSLLKEKLEELKVDETCGLVKNDYGEDGFNRPLVDWPENERDGFAYEEAEYNTVVNAVAYGAFDALSEIARVLGEEADAEDYQRKAECLKADMITYLWDDKKAAFCDGLDKEKKRISHYAQHSTAYSLCFSIYDSKEMKEEMIECLKEDGQMKMSVFSSYFLLEGLYQNDAGDYAMSLLIDDNPENQRTWAYMLREEKATITAEAWSRDIKENMTYSHPWGASPAHLIAAGMFGIRPARPGFETFEIWLQPGNIQKGYIKVPTIKGTVEASYVQSKQGEIEYVKVKIPSNTRAELLIPLEEAPKKLKVNQEERAIEIWDGKYVHLQLGSGEYMIKVFGKGTAF